MTQKRSLLDRVLRRTVPIDVEDAPNLFEPLQETLDKIQAEQRKLGKAQFKANTLVEKQAAAWEKAANAYTETTGNQDEAIVRKGRSDLVKALLPALDGLDQAITAGYTYIHQRDLKGALQAQLPDGQPKLNKRDREALDQWLDGLYLVRDRLLTILANDNVTRIETVGKLFDPYLHVAVGTADTDDPMQKNIITDEEKAGYQSPDRVLRYAEVIVNK